MTTDAQREAVARVVEGLQSRFNFMFLGQANIVADEIIAAYEAAAWQPIETAPRDSSSILAIRAGRVQRLWYFDDRWAQKPKPCWLGSDSDMFGRAWARGNQPTYWRPLPAPPKEPAHD